MNENCMEKLRMMHIFIEIHWAVTGRLKKQNRSLFQTELCMNSLTEWKHISWHHLGVRYCYVIPSSLIKQIKRKGWSLHRSVDSIVQPLWKTYVTAIYWQWAQMEKRECVKVTKLLDTKQRRLKAVLHLRKVSQNLLYLFFFQIIWQEVA